MRISLYTRMMQHVTDILIPKFPHEPDVIVWGARAFRRDLNKASGFYVECWMYAAVGDPDKVTEALILEEASRG